MDLPAYFIADMNPAPALTPEMMLEACRTLKRNREQYLQHRSTAQLIDLIAETASRWLRPDDPIRALALDRGPAATGFSRSVLAEGLDAFFKSITADSLEALIEQDLGHIDRLDQFAGNDPEQRTSRSALASGPELLTHFTAGNLPCPALLSMLLGLLVRSAQFVKCARGTSLLPRLLAHTIHLVDPKAAACLEIAEWPGGQRSDLEEVLIDETDRLTATGSDKTLASFRQKLPANLPWLGYGHRVSFAYAARESLAPYQLPDLLQRITEDLTLWDQLGCLSPHVIYLEQGGKVSPVEFAEQLAGVLQRRQKTHPRGPVPVEMAATIRSKREFYLIRAQASDDTRLWQSEDSTAWTVVYEADPLFQMSCLHRFVYVKPAQSLEEVLKQCDAIRRKVSTVGLAAPARRSRELTRDLARWGATRICPFGHMQRPPVTWRHDGSPALAALVQWTDWERGGES